MKASELKIGNKVDLYGSIATIQAVDFCNTETGTAIENGKPIPLTEEWLIKFGFEKLNEWFDISVGGDRTLGYNAVTKEYTIGYVHEWINMFDNLKYVHQLQNLYFALTNKELVVK